MDRRSRDDHYDDNRDGARGEPAPAGGEGADRPDAAGGHPTAGDGQSEQPGEAARFAGRQFFPNRAG